MAESTEMADSNSQPDQSASQDAIQHASQGAAQQEIHDDHWKPRFNPWVVAFTVTLATFMEALDSSIANVALPHIAGALGASYDEATWVLTSYLVSNAIILPISGWIANRYGRKRFYMVCVALFTVFSLCCGFANSLFMLVFFRVLQGAAGGGLQPSERSILADTFPPEKRSVAFALYGMAVVVAPAIGPTIGGWITDNYSWRWIFFLNIPVGILSLFLSARIVEDPPYLKRMRNKVGSVDGFGLGLLALTIGALQIMLDKGQEKDWFSSGLIIACATIAAVGFISFVWRELTAEHPILDLRLYKNPTFATTQFVMLVIGATLYATTVMIPQFLQEVMGYSATQAGSVLSLGGLVLIVLLPIVGFIGQKVDPRALICFGFAMVSFGVYRISDLYLGIDFWTAASWRVIMVLGMPFLFVPISVMSFVGVPREKNNEVSGLTALARNLGGSVGVSFISTMLVRRAQVHQQYLAAHATPASSLYQSMRGGLVGTLQTKGYSAAGAATHAAGRLYESMMQQAQILAYIDTIHMLVILTVCLIPIAYLMKKPPSRPKEAIPIE